MSRPLTGPKCRLCRRERQKLFLKGEKCFTAKCPVSRRAFPPGIHGQASFKLSEYGRQLREKQKIRRSYGITERQLSGVYAKASRATGNTGVKLLEFLEMRLDNIVYRAGFAPSRNMARQLVNHGHFRVNGRRVDIASMTLRPNDVVTVREGSKAKGAFQKQQAPADSQTAFKAPSWLTVDAKTQTATVVQPPAADELTLLGYNSQMVVEFYSR